MNKQDRLTIDSPLYKTISRQCYVTSSDSEVTERLLTIIENSMVKIKNMLSLQENFDFIEPSEEQGLLISLCNYTWNNISIEDFIKNYQNDIINLRLRNIVNSKGNNTNE